MSDPKSLLLRAFADLTRSTLLYQALEVSTEDVSLKSWFKQAQHRVNEDLSWVRHVLIHKFKVNPRAGCK